MSGKTIDRFWRFVQKTGSCWLWRGNRPNGRYGLFTIKHNQRVGAHRFSWEIANGPIPEGLFVCHHCDNQTCVRPDHLFLGTAKENSLDMVLKGRSTRGLKRPGSGPRGERNSHAVLSMEIVWLIRNSEGTLRDLAFFFGISKSQIGNIRSGKQWQHV